MTKIQTLFSNLVHLTETTEVFYKQEFKLDNSIYWIFNYRLASYSDFQLPSAKWARGTMFEVDSNGIMVRLASLPMPKFFNLNENPETMNLDLNEIDWVETKSDGSLMSTYIHNGELRLKSKGSLFSEQAIDAMKWLNRPENMALKHMLHHSTSIGFTCNLEWCASFNRIVLFYPEPELIYLNHIDMETLRYSGNLVGFREYMFSRPYTNVGNLSMKEFIEQVPDMQDDIEGFVFVMKSGQRVKIKTKKYISLHHAKDSINNPRRLFECVLDEATDDLRSMFSSDQAALELIQNMENTVQKLYNHLVNTVETYYNTNKHLTRKDFAIKGKQSLNSMEFGLAMNLYTGRVNDYKEFMKSRYKEFGILDTIIKKE